MGKLWTNKQMATHLSSALNNLANDIESGFVSRKFSEIRKVGEKRYDNWNVTVWEDAQGNLAWIDFNLEVIGVFYAGIGYLIQPGMQTTCPAA